MIHVVLGTSSQLSSPIYACFHNLLSPLLAGHTSLSIICAAVKS